MLNVVRHSQIIGSIAIDSSTSARFAELEEVWLDDSGRIAYFSGEEAYLPVQGIAGIGMGAVSIYYHPVPDIPDNLHRLDQITVESAHPHHALEEATEFLQEQWQSLQQSISRGTERTKSALDAAWQQITK
ncbi:hypothetical protein PN471_12635 [Aphanizomenon sp. CS-733/32]|uniref:hypothetical protein n=1 Tax=Aphanizomenon sp. CS-733/32 TaxID=3021715 RepID=UPI00232E0CC9|nr:hypothetical protein [Aphanizomenon sp. CS-733/32]MDB9309458.1 hypothetical protein [Aphanizomenon sp. CS-733/32]